MKALLFIIPLLLTLSSCEMTKEIDYSTGNYTPKLVTHGYICPQDGIQVILKTTTNPSSISEDDSASNPEVKIYNDKGEYIELDYTTNNLFTSDSINFIKNDRQYSIQAKADNFTSITSTKQHILDTPIIDSVSITETNTTRAYIHFNNNYEDDVRFFLNVYPYNNGTIDPIYIDSEKFNPFSMLDNINVGSNTVEISTSFYEYDKLLVELYVLSPDLVKFLTSQDNYDYSKEDPFYPQPYPVFSNITGGYGIFASYSYTSTIVNISQKWD